MGTFISVAVVLLVVLILGALAGLTAAWVLLGVLGRVLERIEAAASERIVGPKGEPGGNIHVNNYDDFVGYVGGG